jgi:hypothetical protein
LPAACAHWGSQASDLSLDDPDDEQKSSGKLTALLAEACEGGRLARRLDEGDTKYACLLRALAQHWEKDETEKVILFSSFRVTIDYLARKLRDEGYRVEVMHGGVKESRVDILDRFERQHGPSVLLTSEVGGEGLDMQFCRSMINYDLPWNPMKVEQRIGRIDRIGQKAAAVSVVSLISANTIEEQIYDRLYSRLIEIEKHLGAFEAILGSEIHKLEQRLLDPNLDDKERAREIERQAMAIEKRHQLELELEEEAPALIAHGDMILDRIEENHRPERQVQGDELADYVHEALSRRYPGSRIDDVAGEPGLYEIVLSAEAQLDFRQSLTRANRARTRLNRESRVQAVFSRRPDMPKSVERITTVHPLVRFAADVRRQAAKGLALHPVVHIELDSSHGFSPGRYVSVVEKWVVEGAVRVDRLAFGAVEQGGALLAPQDAERLIQTSLKLGRGAASIDETEHLAALADELDSGPVDERWHRFVDEEAARHADRVDTNLARIARQRNTKARDLEERIDSWKYSGDARKLKLIPAQQGKLKKLLASLDAQRKKNESDRDSFRYRRNVVGLAVVDVAAR